MRRRAPLISRYFTAITLAGVTRGLWVITLGWSSALIGGSVALVGIAFLVGHLMNVILAPSVGALIDRRSRKRLAIFGQTLFGCAMATPWFAHLLGYAPSYAMLLLIAACIAAAALVQGGALDAIQKSIVDKGDIKRTNAIANGLRQGSMIAGAGLGGVVLMWLPIHAGFIVGSALCALVVVCLLGLPDANPPVSARKSYLAQMGEGYRFFLRKPELGRLALLIGLSTSVGQLSNVMLPLLVQNELDGGSELYGLIDALWSVGGIAAAACVARLLRRSGLGGFEYLSIVALGLFTAIVSFSLNSMSVAGLYLLMGFAFSFSKILCDGRMIELADMESIGRVRTYTQAVTSAFGLIVFSMPALTGVESVRTHYVFWGLGVVVIAAAIYLTTNFAGAAVGQATTERDAHD
ncbi:MFS transporter [Agrobacterium sp. M50-1]|uniref:MFS transporter n=1 Tax=Agrobacterium sp. M50-1 TaxID=3132821 RepID=UPI003CE5C04C